MRSAIASRKQPNARVKGLEARSFNIANLEFGIAKSDVLPYGLFLLNSDS